MLPWCLDRTIRNGFFLLAVDELLDFFKRKNGMLSNPLVAQAIGKFLHSPVACLLRLNSFRLISLLTDPEFWKTVIVWKASFVCSVIKAWREGLSGFLRLHSG